MALLVEVATTVAPVLLLALIGYVWTRGGWAYDVEFVTRLSMTSTNLTLYSLYFIHLFSLNGDTVLCVSNSKALLI
jgi:hypothetical protein